MDQLLKSIKIKWSPTNISGIIVNDQLQIIDGRHRLTALKMLGKEEFEKIFGSEGQSDLPGGVRINIYKDLNDEDLLSLSQSNF